MNAENGRSRLLYFLMNCAIYKAMHKSELSSSSFVRPTKNSKKKRAKHVRDLCRRWWNCLALRFCVYSCKERDSGLVCVLHDEKKGGPCYLVGCAALHPAWKFDYLYDVYTKCCDGQRLTDNRLKWIIRNQKQTQTKRKQNIQVPIGQVFLILCPGSIGRDGWWKDKQKGNIYTEEGAPCLYCTFTQEWLGVHKRHRSDMPLSISLYIPDYYFFYVSLTASIPSQTLLTSRWCTRVHHRKKKREK